MADEIHRLKSLLPGEDVDGGPAFPRPPVINLNDPDSDYESTYCEGMSLRDWLAGMAISRLAGTCSDEEAAGRAYDIAQLMIDYRTIL